MLAEPSRSNRIWRGDDIINRVRDKEAGFGNVL